MRRRARRATLPDPVRWRRPLSYLPNAILEPKRPVRALLVAWALSLSGTVALAALASTLMPGAETPRFDAAGPAALFLLVVFAPVVETLIMGAALLVLVRFFGPTLAVLASAAGWGAAHSAIAPVWGLVIWWPFVIFSTLFLAWRKRSLAAAFAMPAAAHALQNLLPSLLIAFGPPG